MISEEQLCISNGSNLRITEELEIDSLTDNEMSLYFKSLINSISFHDKSVLGLSGVLNDEVYSFIQENIIKNISGNISVLQILCYIVLSKFNDLMKIKIEYKE